MERLPWAVWMVWTMLAAGLFLTAASLLQTSGRVRLRKGTRHQGESVRSEGVLRVGQTLALACPAIPPVNPASMSPLPDADPLEMVNNASVRSSREAESDIPTVRGVVGRVVEQERGRLVFALESQEITPAPTSQTTRFTPRIGDSLTLLTTGASEMYRFEAKAQAVHTEGNAPNRTLVTVKLPSRMARIQRRRHRRAPVQSVATLRSAVSNSTKSVCTESVRCALLDLSCGGLQMEIANVHSPHAIARLCDSLPSGSIVDIDLDLPLLRGSAVRVRIRSCQRVAARGGLALRLRGEFIQLPSWQQEAILRHVVQA